MDFGNIGLEKEHGILEMPPSEFQMPYFGLKCHLQRYLPCF